MSRKPEKIGANTSRTHQNVLGFCFTSRCRESPVAMLEMKIRHSEGYHVSSGMFAQQMDVDLF